VSNVKELVALAKQKPKTLNFASAGVGSPLHLAGELLQSRAGIQLTHVPYKGGGPAAAAVLAGEAQLIFGSVASSLPFVKAGKLKALATTGLKRSKVAPDVPTMAESGLPGFEAVSWIGALVPVGTPQPIVDKIHTDLVAVLRMPEVKQQLGALGAEVVGNSEQEFAAWNRNEIAKWSKAVKESGAKVD